MTLRISPFLGLCPQMPLSPGSTHRHVRGRHRVETRQACGSAGAAKQRPPMQWPPKMVTWRGPQGRGRSESSHAWARGAGHRGPGVWLRGTNTEAGRLLPGALSPPGPQPICAAVERAQTALFRRDGACFSRFWGREVQGRGAVSWCLERPACCTLTWGKRGGARQLGTCRAFLRGFGPTHEGGA